MIRNDCAVQTYSGGRFDINNPDESMVRLEDIAHSLSRLCRFNGHTRLFYSVAEHCCHMASLAPIGCGRTWLLHDAHEAYLGDVPSPIKWQLKECTPWFADRSRVIQGVIESALGLQGVKGLDSELLDRHDMQMLVLESDVALVGGRAFEWPIPPGIPPADVTLQFWDPDRAREEFLRIATHGAVHSFAPIGESP